MTGLAGQCLLALAILAAVRPGYPRALRNEGLSEDGLQNDYYAVPGWPITHGTYNYGYQPVASVPRTSPWAYESVPGMMADAPAPKLTMQYGQPSSYPDAVVPQMGYMEPAVLQMAYPGPMVAQPVYNPAYLPGYPVMDAASQNLGPNFAGVNQVPYQEVSNDEEFNTLVKAGGPYSGAFARESLLDNQDIIIYMSMPNEMDDIPLTAVGHDLDEHNKLLHEPAQRNHGFLTEKRGDMEEDQAAIAKEHDGLVDKSIHALSQIGTQHNEVIHHHVHPEDISRFEADWANLQATPMQRDQKEFEHKLDQLTWKINSEKEAKHYGESQFELKSAEPGDPNHVAEGMPFEVLLRGGSYYDRIGRHTYITSSTAITLGALLGIIFLLCGCLLAIIYCKGVLAVLDFFLCLLGFSCLLPLPLPKPDLTCGNKGNCCKCSQPVKYPKVLKPYLKK